MNCKICKSEVSLLFQKQVINRYLVNYYQCNSCDFVQTENPYWLTESYAQAISALDVGIVYRNLFLKEVTQRIMEKAFSGKDSVYIDYGGGTGLFVRLMRDAGFDFYRQDKYCENIFANFFDITNLTEGVRFDFLTAFEVFEHLHEPLPEIKKMLMLSDSIFFSTELQPNEEKIADWWYIMPESGQHIAFYSLNSLKNISNQLQCYLYTNNKNLHLLSKNKIFESNDDFLKTITTNFSDSIAQKLSRFLSFSKDKTESLIERDFEFIKQKIYTQS